MAIAGASLVLLILASGCVWGLAFWGQLPEPPAADSLPETEPKLSLPALGLVLFLVGSSLLARFSSSALPVEAVKIEQLKHRTVEGLAVAGLIFVCLQISRGVALRDYGFRLSELPRQFLVGSLAFLGSLLPVYSLLFLTSPLRTAETVHPFLQLLQSQPGPQTVFWIGFSVIVAAPLLEELIYRVILQSALVRWLPAGIAIPLTAAVFCLVHGWPDMIPLLPLALILGFVFYRYKSYLAIVLTHALFNGWMLLWALLVPVTPEEPPPPSAYSGTTPNGLLPSVSVSYEPVFTVSPTSDHEYCFHPSLASLDANCLVHSPWGDGEGEGNYPQIGSQTLRFPLSCRASLPCRFRPLKNSLP